MAGAVHAVIGTDDGRVAEEALALFNELKPEGDAAPSVNDQDPQHDGIENRPVPGFRNQWHHGIQRGVELSDRCA